MAPRQLGTNRQEVTRTTERFLGLQAKYLPVLTLTGGNRFATCLRQNRQVGNLPHEA
jgi:hypothetical protein